TILATSALHGTGLTEWLEAVMSRTDAGKRLLEIDYDTYAHGEAVLGWLNGTLMLHGTCSDWDAWLRRLMETLATRFDTKGYAVGHVKAIAENGKAYAVGNLTGTRETLTLRGHAGAGEDLKLILNARVETTPEELNRLIKEVLTELLGDTLREEVLAWRFLQPGRPNPTHRFTEIVPIQ
ncbi:MAG: cobalamin synthesis protein P47K, partial [bacterium]|nr:cobalamin synthesis protein P47K [bacterium]